MFKTFNYQKISINKLNVISNMTESFFFIFIPISEMSAERGEAKCTTTLKALKGGRSKWMSNTFFLGPVYEKHVKDKDNNCVVCYNVIL